MLILTEADVRSLITLAEAVPAIRQAVAEEAGGRVVNPHRTVIEYPSAEAAALHMPSAMPAIGQSAVKVVTIFPHNPAQGLRTTQGVILLSSSEDGRHLACMDASYLTRLRTGAIAAVASDFLARTDARVVAVTGCGQMAWAQLAAMLHIRPIEQIRLWNRHRSGAEAFQAALPQYLPDYQGEVLLCDDADRAVAEADIVVAATRATRPFFSAAALRPGTHIVGVGSYLPHMQEIGTDVLQRCSKIVVDTLAGVQQEAGDFLVPSAAGAWSWERLYGEVGQLVTGALPGRQQADEITFFKSVGVAYFDLAVASVVYRQAVAQGVGVEVAL